MTSYEEGMAKYHLTEDDLFDPDPRPCDEDIATEERAAQRRDVERSIYEQADRDDLECEVEAGLIDPDEGDR